MTCPSCGGELVAGADRCPVCEAAPMPRVEGALAADPRRATPPARARARTDEAAEPIREIPGLRRREPRERAERPERSWRDEVQERIRSRRQKRSEAGLPLFEQHEVREPAEPPVAPATQSAAASLAAEAGAVATAAGPLAAEATAPRAAAANASVTGPSRRPLTEAEVLAPALSEAELADLPLRDSLVTRSEPTARATAARREPPSLDDEALLEEPDLEPRLDLSPPPGEAVPIERTAGAGERTQAAALDLALFAAIATVVVYFASRAARVDLLGLAGAWPWLFGFLGLLAAFYACYFTGTTGQTPGKLITHLHVVDGAGRPPGYARALGRSLVGLFGIALVGLGLLPMTVDPAGRTLHDRLFRTRVVRR
jgi:uncharacterized RDD family membrane protein YckC